MRLCVCTCNKIVAKDATEFFTSFTWNIMTQPALLPQMLLPQMLLPR